MTTWLGSISTKHSGNWEICKQEQLFGSDRPAALNVRAGDDILVWGAERGWLGRCRATDSARPPRSLSEVPWPDPERYAAVIPMTVIDEPPVPLFMSGEEFMAAAGIHTVQIRNFESIDDERAAALAQLLSTGLGRASQAPSQPAHTFSENTLEARLIASLDELRVDHQLGVAAPYQQLVLLWAISRAVHGHEPLQAFSSARDELKALLARFAVGRSAPDPALPWFALRNSPLWKLIGAPSGPIHRGRDVVREGNLVAGLTREAHDLVRANVDFRESAVAKLTASLRGHSALPATLAFLFPEQPSTPQPHAEAIDVLSDLIGRKLQTTTGATNEILAVQPPDVVVATSRSPQGQPVPISEVQRGIDLLRLNGAVTIDVGTLGHRSSFIGAVLATRDDAIVSGSPPVVSLAGETDQPSTVETNGPTPAPTAEPQSEDSYEPGRIYDRGDLHEAAREAGLPPGNRTAGIQVVGRDLCVFWNPFKRLYANQWLDEPREFTYSGEGSVGDQTETGGNLRLIEHEAEGAPVKVFVKIKRDGSSWLHLGEYRVAEHWWGDSPDADGNLRRDLRFRFAALTEPKPGVAEQLPELPPAPPPPPPTEAELWEALERRGETGQRRRGTRTQTNRRMSDPLKTHYVTQRAIDFGRACELCDRQLGWVGDDGRPHFQAHHIDADIDLVDWIAALCGSCHDRMHHSADRSDLVDLLLTKVQSRQEERGRPITGRHLAGQVSPLMPR